MTRNSRKEIQVSDNENRSKEQGNAPAKKGAARRHMPARKKNPQAENAAKQDNAVKAPRKPRAAKPKAAAPAAKEPAMPAA